MSAYVPEKGDFITLSFDPQSGSEAKRQTPCGCYQQSSFQSSDRLSNCLPDHEHESKHPFSFACTNLIFIDRFIMIEQVKSVDYNARKAKFVEQAPLQLVEDVIALVDVCIK
jgi:mRNA interferase MazF